MSVVRQPNTGAASAVFVPACSSGVLTRIWNSRSPRVVRMHAPSSSDSRSIRSLPVVEAVMAKSSIKPAGPATEVGVGAAGTGVRVAVGTGAGVTVGEAAAGGVGSGCGASPHAVSAGSQMTASTAATVRSLPDCSLDRAGTPSRSRADQRRMVTPPSLACSAGRPWTPCRSRQTRRPMSWQRPRRSGPAAGRRVF